jgi:hypothetical protein
MGEREITPFDSGRLKTQTRRTLHKRQTARRKKISAGCFIRRFFSVPFQASAAMRTTEKPFLSSQTELFQRFTTAQQTAGFRRKA